VRPIVKWLVAGVFGVPVLLVAGVTSGGAGVVSTTLILIFITAAGHSAFSTDPEWDASESAAPRTDTEIELFTVSIDGRLAPLTPPPPPPPPAPTYRRTITMVGPVLLAWLWWNSGPQAAGLVALVLGIVYEAVFGLGHGNTRYDPSLKEASRRIRALARNGPDDSGLRALPDSAREFAITQVHELLERHRGDEPGGARRLRRRMVGAFTWLGVCSAFAVPDLSALYRVQVAMVCIAVGMAVGYAAWWLQDREATRAQRRFDRYLQSRAESLERRP